MRSHIRVAKKEQTDGLGFKSSSSVTAGNEWWLNAYAAGASRLGGAAADDGGSVSDTDSDGTADAAAIPRSSRQRKRTRSDGGGSDSDASAGERAAAPVRTGDEDPYAVPSFEELFRATGGARLGMRARRAQPGKWARAEHGVVGAAVTAAATVMSGRRTDAVAPANAVGGGTVSLAVDADRVERKLRKAEKAARRAARRAKASTLGAAEDEAAAPDAATAEAAGGEENAAGAADNRHDDAAVRRLSKQMAKEERRRRTRGE